jgi:amino-acid N-acetyltransferase
MMDISYHSAKLTDVVAMQELVLPEVKSGKILFRSDDEISTNIRSYTLAKQDDKLLGFVALHIHAPNLAEVRSLIVSESARGKGIGQELVKKTLDEGKKLGVEKIFTLTYEQRFFEKLTFNEIPKESLPEHKIWADCIKCKHFPICDEIALIIVL